MTGAGSYGSADREKLGPALSASSSGPSCPQPSNSSINAAFRLRDRRGGIAMRAAQRLGDDPVDHAQREQIGGGDLHRFRRVGAPCRRSATGSRRSLRARSPNRRHVRTSARGWRRQARWRRPSRPRRRWPRSCGTPSARHCSVERAIASAWPRSSAWTPGKAPDVSTRRHDRQAEAIGQGSSGGSPCDSPRAWPCRNCGAGDWRCRRPFRGRSPSPGGRRSGARPPMIAGSSPNARSPASGRKSSTIPAT